MTLDNQNLNIILGVCAMLTALLFMAAFTNDPADALRRRLMRVGPQGRVR